jgi:hypothetical protein
MTDCVVPWSALRGLIEPFFPKPGNGHPPVGMRRMLRIYFCSNGSIYRIRRWKRRSTKWSARRARDFVNRRYCHRGVVDEVERSKNGIKWKGAGQGLTSDRY